MKACEAGADRRLRPFAVVEVTHGARVMLDTQPFPGDPRTVVEEIANRRGVWRDNAYYPPHRVVRVMYEE